MKLSASPVVGLILLATLVEASAAYNVLDHWTKRATNVVNRVRFVGGQFVAVGNNGLIMTSSNGANWTLQNSGTNATLNGVAYGYGEYVAVGDRVMLRSADAINWTNLALTNQSINLQDISFGGNRFVAVGLPISPQEASVLVSPTLLPPVPFATNGWFTRNFYTNGFNASFRAVAYAVSRWIAVGDIGTGIFISSSGGNTWTYGYTSNTNVDFNQYRLGVAYGNSVAISVGQEGLPHVAASPFASWTPYLVVTNGGFGVFNVTNYFVGDDIAFGDGRFVVPRGGAVLETTNGADWVIHDGVLNGIGRKMAYGAGCFVTASYSGIYQSDNIAGSLAARRTNAGGPVELSLTIEPQRTFGVQATTNFTQWTEIWRGTNTSGGTPRFLDWSVTNGVSRYYRTVTP